MLDRFSSLPWPTFLIFFKPCVSESSTSGMKAQLLEMRIPWFLDPGCATHCALLHAAHGTATTTASWPDYHKPHLPNSWRSPRLQQDSDPIFFSYSMQFQFISKVLCALFSGYRAAEVQSLKRLCLAALIWAAQGWDLLVRRQIAYIIYDASCCQNNQTSLKI